MKKIAFAAMLLAVIFLNADTNVCAETKSGIKAGISAANVIGDDAGSSSTVPGWFAGVYTSWRWNDILAIQPELLYSVKGTEATLPAPLSTVDIRLHYIELPILGVLNIPVGETDFQVFAGPYAAYLMTVTDDGGRELSGTLDQLNRVDFGAVAGAGIGFEFLFGRMVLGARYTVGLNTLSEDADNDFRNSVMSIFAGFDI